MACRAPCAPDPIAARTWGQYALALVATGILLDLVGHVLIKKRMASTFMRQQWDNAAFYLIVNGFALSFVSTVPEESQYFIASFIGAGVALYSGALLLHTTLKASGALVGLSMLGGLIYVSGWVMLARNSTPVHEFARAHWEAAA